METTAEDIRIRLAVTRIKRQDVAAAIDMDDTLFGRYINGRRRMPEGFGDRVMSAIDQMQALETAQHAA